MDLRKFSPLLGICALSLGISLPYPVEAGQGDHTPPSQSAIRADASPNDDNAPVLFQMGKNYWFGEDGYPQDRTKAIELIRKSARADYPPALYYLSRIYMTREEACFNERDGVDLLRRAAQLGLKDAERQLREYEQERDWRLRERDGLTHSYGR
jgi:TPR repeat protein